MNRILIHIVILSLALSICAQPPMPPPPLPLVSPVNSPKPRTPAFTVTCPHCGMKLARYHALAVQTNGWHSSQGGNVCERTIHFVCPSADCKQQFTAKNEKFVPEVIAIEETE